MNLSDSVGIILFESQSTDETALLQEAKANGYSLLERTNYNICLNILGKKVNYSVLCTLDFTSERKRMSVIVKTPENKIMLYCKGADSVLFERSKNKDVVAGISKVVQSYSVSGLRTLVMGYRELTEKQFNEWFPLYKNAALEIHNREKSIALIADIIERDLILIGCTGIEDKLQEGVPETIDYLLRAGLQVWVLTGDKVSLSSVLYKLSNRVKLPSILHIMQM